MDFLSYSITCTSFLLTANIGWWFMVFNATFNNISFISWRSVLLLEETGVPGENHRPVTSHWQTLSHNVVQSTQCYRWCTDCIGSCKFNYHTIMTMGALTLGYKWSSVLKTYGRDEIMVALGAHFIKNFNFYQTLIQWIPIFFHVQSQSSTSFLLILYWKYYTFTCFHVWKLFYLPSPTIILR